MKSKIRPNVRIDNPGDATSTQVMSHPAFGCITVNRPNGGIGHLFGSDIDHHGCISITIQRAEMYRNLSRDWHHPRKELIELELSYSQFAEMVSSAGKGTGILCTLRRYMEGGEYQQVPEIEPLESKHDIMKREVRDMATRTLEGINAAVKQLEGLLERTNIPKAEMRGILHTLRCSLDNAPSNMSFVVDQAQETIASAASSAKTDVEAFTDHHLKRLGMDSVQALLGKDQKP